MPEEPALAPKGCLGTVQSLGMAFYAIGLLCIMCTGTTCAVASLVGLTLPEDPLESGLMAGHEAGAFRLDQLYQAGLLPAGAVPTLYFDGSRVSDGSTGCVFHDGELASWSLGQETGRVPVAGATVTELGRAITVAQPDASVTCALTDGASAGRFARMMTTEAAR